MTSRSHGSVCPSARLHRSTPRTLVLQSFRYHRPRRTPSPILKSLSHVTKSPKLIRQSLRPPTRVVRPAARSAAQEGKGHSPEPQIDPDPPAQSPVAPRQPGTPPHHQRPDHHRNIALRPKGAPQFGYVSQPVALAGYHRRAL